MAVWLPIALAAIFCLASWAVARAANRAFRHHGRLPGLFSLRGHAEQLDPRPLAVFLPSLFLTLICVAAVAIALAVPDKAVGDAAIVIAGTGLGMLASQFISLRLTGRWAVGLG